MEHKSQDKNYIPVWNSVLKTEEDANLNGLRLPLVPLSVCENNMKIKSIFEGQGSLQILNSLASE